jgi:hypothetical protein
MITWFIIYYERSNNMLLKLLRFLQFEIYFELKGIIIISTHILAQFITTDNCGCFAINVFILSGRPTHNSSVPALSKKSLIN